jgi:mRNA interferase MazF
MRKRVGKWGNSLAVRIPKAFATETGLALLCPVTRQIKGYPFEVHIPTGLGVRGVILADRVKSLDWQARRAELARQLPVGTTADVLRKVNTLLAE